MSLVDLWKTAHANLEDKHVQQIITFAGSGQLIDGSQASDEFRAFLSRIPSRLLEKYANDCLGEKFDNRGLALQDVINEIGSRLGFIVTAGRYRGVPNESGHDGVWHFPDKSRAIVIEVKTTDAYRIDLRTLANYRRSILTATKLEDDSVSILIVLGSEETENLESQIRGSRYAWGIRLISVGALVRLLKLKEQTEDSRVFRKIQEILVPHEFTKLDEIIDLVFQTAQDVRQGETASVEFVVEELGRKPKFIPVAFNQECVDKVELYLGKSLIKKSRSKYGSSDGSLAVVCAASRQHGDSEKADYWFAFHPHQKETLKDTREAYVALGCGSASQTLLIPFSSFEQWLEGMNVTELEDRFYWHVSVSKESGRFLLHRKKGFDRIDLTQYLLKTKTSSKI